VGDNVEFRGTIKTALKSQIKINGKVLNVENFGAAIGDNAKLTDVFLQPGTLIWPGLKIHDKDLRGIIKK
jgi:hypothetical protein